MREVLQPSLFAVHGRFLRSTHLERDWSDPNALQDYTLTAHAQQSLARLATGLKPSSSLRAWRITGDYGSGKSSFALLVAHLLSKRPGKLPNQLAVALRESVPELTKKSRLALLPVLVTGSREPMGAAILRAMATALRETEADASFIELLDEVSSKTVPNDTLVLKWVRDVQRYLAANKLANGIVIILDEAGKFLEYAALRPDQQDVYLLQGLAEAAARSGETPLMVLALLHQGVSTYAEGLPKSQQREWEKVAGRYEEIIWHHPLEQVANLVAHALNTQLENAPPRKVKWVKADMQEALRQRWYGVISTSQQLVDVAARLYPLHPTVLPPLVRLFANFGQNERSLYTFLLGTEPFGLQDFVTRTEGKEVFRLCDLFDYARSVFGSRLSLHGYLNHWKAIDGIISSYGKEDELELQVLKTVGLLNVLNADDLLASSEVLVLALNHCGEVEAAINKLQTKHFLHFRGRAGGYCLWSNTSVDLEGAHNEARRALGPVINATALIRDRIEIRPLVARRHYIRTGNLRHFEVKYVDVASLETQFAVATTADGLILVPLCETQLDVTDALRFALDTEVSQRTDVLVAIPQPLQGLLAYVEQLRRWEWIERSVGELQQDRYAREEVSRQLVLAQQKLSEQLQLSVGLLNPDGETGLRWYHGGTQVRGLNSGRDVMELLTRVCEQHYPESPCIHNELINRRVLSSAGAAARLRLCERLFESPTQPLLGMDADKKPPEMSMYLSVLQEAGIHQRRGENGNWTVGLPDEDYDQLHCRVRPALLRIHDVLRRNVDARVPVTEVFDALRLPPYGVRDGLIPLLLAVFAVIHEQELAFYEDGSFIPRMSGTYFLRLIKAPETFDIQYHPITGVRTELFHLLMQELALTEPIKAGAAMLDVVKPLLVFTASLPFYALKTARLTSQTKAVRHALVSTTDPVALLFHELPKACGLTPVTTDLEDEATQTAWTHRYAEALKTSIDELRGAYPSLLQFLKKRLQQEFELPGTFDQFRAAVAPRAKAVAAYVTEPRLKSFCLRLADTALSEARWLESLGNLLCSMPPAKWRDNNRDAFEQEAHALSAQFRRVEAVQFAQRKNISDGESVRVALTHPDGQEREQVIYLSTDELDEVASIEQEIMNLLKGHMGRIGMAAATRALWAMLPTEGNKHS